MSKHTQTPWVIIRINGHGGMEVESDMKSIATVYLNYQRLGATFEECTDDPRNAESVANARLIAESPALLAALERLARVAIDSVEYSDWPELQAAVEAAWQAIDRAKGA